MIKINQTRFGEGIGNCFASCVCCLLEIEDPESVPNFCFMADNWWSAFKDWMIENYNLKAKFAPLLEHEIKNINAGEWNFSHEPPVILMGYNHNNIGHAVVYCPDNTIWNTNRTCQGLISIDGYVYFEPNKKHDST